MDSSSIIKQNVLRIDLYPPNTLEGVQAGKGRLQSCTGPPREDVRAEPKLLSLCVKLSTSLCPPGFSHSPASARLSTETEGAGLGPGAELLIHRERIKGT